MTVVQATGARVNPRRKSRSPRLIKEKHFTHTNTQQEQHNTRPDKNNTTHDHTGQGEEKTGHTHKHTTRTTQHTTRQEQQHKRPHGSVRREHRSHTQTHNKNNTRHGTTRTTHQTTTRVRVGSTRGGNFFPFAITLPAHDERETCVDVVVSVCVLLFCFLCVAVCSTSLVCAVRSVSKTLARGRSHTHTTKTRSQTNKRHNIVFWMRNTGGAGVKQTLRNKDCTSLSARCSGNFWPEPITLPAPDDSVTHSEQLAFTRYSFVHSGIVH